MDKIELTTKYTESLLEMAKKEVTNYVHQLKMYAEDMNNTTEPFKVMDSANSITAWSKHLQQAMRKVDELTERLQMLQYLAEEGNE